MPSLHLYGKTLDLPSKAFLTDVVGILLSPFDVVRSVYWAQQVGQSITTRREYLPLLESCLSLIKDNVNIIDDKVIRECSQGINDALASFIKLSQDLILWESVNVTSYARRRHRHLTLDVGSFEIAPWVAHADYQVILKLITNSVSLYFETLIKLIPYIEPMIREAGSESLTGSIARFKQQIPDYRLNLEVGFQEYVRIKAAESE